MIRFREGPMDGLHNDMFGEEKVTGVWDPEHNIYRLLNEDGTEHGFMDSPAFSQKMKRARWWRRRQLWSLILAFLAILLYIAEGVIPDQAWRLILLGIAFPMMMFAWALK